MKCKHFIPNFQSLNFLRALKEGIVNIWWSYLFSLSQYPGAAPEGTDCRSQLLAADQQEDSMVRVEHHKTGAATNPQP